MKRFYFDEIDASIIENQWNKICACGMYHTGLTSSYLFEKISKS